MPRVSRAKLAAVRRAALGASAHAACRHALAGVLAANKIGPMISDMNVDTTFEGDNSVMMQQARPAGPA